MNTIFRPASSSQLTTLREFSSSRDRGLPSSRIRANGVGFAQQPSFISVGNSISSPQAPFSSQPLFTSAGASSTLFSRSQECVDRNDFLIATVNRTCADVVMQFGCDGTMNIPDAMFIRVICPVQCDACPPGIEGGTKSL